MGIREAISALVSIEVEGVRCRWDVDELPGQVRAAQLPALLPLLEAPQEGVLRHHERGQVSTARFDGTLRMEYELAHLLLVAPVGKHGADAQALALVDAYVAALKDDPTLGGRLAEAMQYAIEPGVYEYGGDRFVGVLFRHKWVFML